MPWDGAENAKMPPAHAGEAQTGGWMPHRNRRDDRTNRGYFGVAVYQPKTAANIGTLWRSATAYGAAFLATVGRRYTRQASDTCASTEHTPLHHYADIDDLLAHLPHSCPLIGVELDDNAVSLDGFTHPMRALYLLGAEDYGIPPSALRRCHQVVQIPSMVKASLNVSVAGALIMYSRYMSQTNGKYAPRLAPVPEDSTSRGT